MSVRVEFIAAARSGLSFASSQWDTEQSESWTKCLKLGRTEYMYHCGSGPASWLPSPYLKPETVDTCEILHSKNRRIA